MKKQFVVRLTLLVAFTASVVLAEAGQAVPRHGGSSSGSSSGSSGGSSGGGGGSTASSGGGSRSGGGSSSDGGGYTAPRRHGGGGSQAGRGRGGDSDSGGQQGAVRRGGGSNDGNQPSGPDYARPGGGNVVGYAVPRNVRRPPGRPGGDYPYYYFSPYRFQYYPWGFGSYGLGYIMDPFWWGPGYGGYPYGYGYGYGSGYGYGGGYSSGGSQYDEDQGGLRIKVKPREARVRVDGYFVGTVDDFDGAFQKVRLDDGPHKVELSLDGYQPVTFDVLIVSGQTTTYRGKMQQR